MSGGSPHHPVSDTPNPGGLSIAPGVVVPEGLLRWQYSRSGGPGGQNVNKVSTKAELRIGVDELPISNRARRRLRELAGRRIAGSQTVVDEQGQPHERGGELILTSETERSQSGNRSECLARLRELLVEAMHVPKVRRKTKPSKASQRRRVEGKKIRGEIKRRRSGGGEGD